MTIGVLIPAFRPTFLGEAIASVLTQGFQDYQLIVSDDSGGDQVRSVVERFADPRIDYRRTSGLTGAAANLRDLWRWSAHTRLKFLFDDDILLPNALIDLVDAADRVPEASIVFGHRDVIDAAGRIQAQPRVVSPDTLVKVSAEQTAATLLKGCDNRIGELSNVLINRASGVDFDDVLTYRGLHLSMLGDVALYLNGSRKGPLVGIGRTVGQFRRHENQHSSWRSNSQYLKVVAEWELFIRGEFGAGAIDAPTALSGVDVLERLYGIWRGRLPKLAFLAEGLPELRMRIAGGSTDLLDGRFLATWSALDLEEGAGSPRQRPEFLDLDEP